MGRVYLEKRQPDRNQYRYYAIQVLPTLFGGWTEQQEWGRIGHPGTVRETNYPTEQEAQTASNQWRQRKQRRGYRIMGNATMASKHQ
jgi:predicted DNA-binding WGR domain protein